VWGGYYFSIVGHPAIGVTQLSLLPHSAIQRPHDESENNEINRLDKLGNTSRHRRWWSLD